MILSNYKVQRRKKNTENIYFLVLKFKSITSIGESKNIFLKRSAASLHDLNKIFLSATCEAHSISAFTTEWWLRLLSPAVDVVLEKYYFYSSILLSNFKQHISFALEKCHHHIFKNFRAQNAFGRKISLTASNHLLINTLSSFLYNQES